MKINSKNGSKNYLKQDIDSRNVGKHWSRDARNVKVFGRNKYSRLSREWKMYGHLEYWMDVLRCLIKRVASSEKNIEIENQVVKELDY